MFVSDLSSIHAYTLPLHKTEDLEGHQEHKKNISTTTSVFHLITRFQYYTIVIVIVCNCMGTELNCSSQINLFSISKHTIISISMRHFEKNKK